MKLSFTFPSSDSETNDVDVLASVAGDKQKLRLAFGNREVISVSPSPVGEGFRITLGPMPKKIAGIAYRRSNAPSDT